ncbi:MAG: hypothetical protein QM666_06545 [Acinetobacter sp.]
MAFDSIWKQQLTLVSYGNEYLMHDISLFQWRQHAIFNQHLLQFRDLLSQHLLAQHFEVWLEQLKKQGVTRLSLHASSLLNDEQNPNANVELLPYTHFIVSHTATKKTAWICGHELAEWYNATNEYEFPEHQAIQIRVETLWSYELPAKLSKKIQADLQQPDWDEIEQYLNSELFHSTYAANLPAFTDEEYTGSLQTIAADTTIQSTPHTPTAILPSRYKAQLANDLLFKFDQLQQHLANKKTSNAQNETTITSPEQSRQLQHFSEKVDDLFAKLIVKIANHYQSAQRKVSTSPSPFDQEKDNILQFKSKSAAQKNHVSSGNVITLILITIALCVAAYYFGF